MNVQEEATMLLIKDMLERAHDNHPDDHENMALRLTRSLEEVNSGNDEAERALCQEAGKPGHYGCGLCPHYGGISYMCAECLSGNR